MWLHNKWRELLRSMSWLRPGDKFDKRTLLIQDNLRVQINIEFTKDGLGFYNGVIGNTRVRCKLAVSHKKNI